MSTSKVFDNPVNCEQKLQALVMMSSCDDNDDDDDS